MSIGQMNSLALEGLCLSVDRLNFLFVWRSSLSIDASAGSTHRTATLLRILVFSFAGLEAAFIDLGVRYTETASGRATRV